MSRAPHVPEAPAPGREPYCLGQPLSALRAHVQMALRLRELAAEPFGWDSAVIDYMLETDRGAPEALTLEERSERWGWDLSRAPMSRRMARVREDAADRADLYAEKRARPKQPAQPPRNPSATPAQPPRNTPEAESPDSAQNAGSAQPSRNPSATPAQPERNPSATCIDRIARDRPQTQTSDPDPSKKAAAASRPPAREGEAEASAAAAGVLADGGKGIDPERGSKNAAYLLLTARGIDDDTAKALAGEHHGRVPAVVARFDADGAAGRQHGTGWILTAVRDGWMGTAAALAAPVESRATAPRRSAEAQANMDRMRASASTPAASPDVAAAAAAEARALIAMSGRAVAERSQSLRLARSTRAERRAARPPPPAEDTIRPPDPEAAAQRAAVIGA